MASSCEYSSLLNDAVDGLVHYYMFVTTYMYVSKEVCGHNAHALTVE